MGYPFAHLGARTEATRQVMNVRRNSSVEKKALSLLSALEQAGRPVSRVVVEGRRIEFVLASGEAFDDFDRIDMRHGKT
jgi:hypothetical protein